VGSLFLCTKQCKIGSPSGLYLLFWTRLFYAIELHPARHAAVRVKSRGNFGLPLGQRGFHKSLGPELFDQNRRLLFIGNWDLIGIWDLGFGHSAQTGDLRNAPTAAEAAHHGGDCNRARPLVFANARRQD